MNAAVHLPAGPEAAALEIIGGSDAPLGSRQIAKQLRGRGFQVSEATVSRLLRKLDGREWTRPAGSKGRMLTHAGRRELDELVAMRPRPAPGYLDVRTLHDVLDLLRARRALEREAVRAAAAQIGEADLARLRTLLERQSTAAERGEQTAAIAAEFHLAIVQASQNKLLGAMAELAFDPALDGVGAVLDVIVGSQQRHAVSIPEHEEIVEGLEARDADRAERAMLRHLDRLLEEVETFERGEHAMLIDRVVAWMTSERAAGSRGG